MYGILDNLNILEYLNNGSECYSDNAYNKCLDMMLYQWEENILSKSKLRTIC